ncbi:MAG: toxin-activating lysine-acyltransferase [Paracoccaceae bacterium]
MGFETVGFCGVVRAMGRDAEDFIRTTLRHFATLRKNPDSAVGTAFPKGWFDLPDALWADLGAMFYLTALTGFHRGRSLADALTMLEPPLRLGQYRVFRTPDGQPRAFVSWAGLSAAAERWFAVEHMPLRPEDWNSGPSKWLIDAVAPFGHRRDRAGPDRQPQRNPRAHALAQQDRVALSGCRMVAAEGRRGGERAILRARASSRGSWRSRARRWAFRRSAGRSAAR